MSHTAHALIKDSPHFEIQRKGATELKVRILLRNRRLDSIGNEILGQGHSGNILVSGPEGQLRLADE